MTALPHFSLPFRFNRLRTGELEVAVREQDTIDEIADCVELTLRTVQGGRVGDGRPTLPGFGRPDMLPFTTHHELARSLTQQCIDEAEPRVRAIVEREDFDANDEGLMRLLAMYQLASEATERMTFS